jgi:hypothetical protein
VPFDAYGIGNHELYESSTARELVDSGFVKWLDGGYITSNVVWSSGVEAGSPIGSRYKVGLSNTWFAHLTWHLTAGRRSPFYVDGFIVYRSRSGPGSAPG